jgi:hypothetical protein
MEMRLVRPSWPRSASRGEVTHQSVYADSSQLSWLGNEIDKVRSDLMNLRPRPTRAWLVNQPPAT